MAADVVPMTPENEGGNAYDWDKAGEFIIRVENVQADIDKIDDAALIEKEPLRADMAEVKKEMKENLGIPIKAFNAAVSSRRAEKKSAQHREKLSTDHKDVYDQIRSALGDFSSTELGQAALKH